MNIRDKDLQDTAKTNPIKFSFIDRSNEKKRFQKIIVTLHS